LKTPAIDIKEFPQFEWKSAIARKPICGYKDKYIQVKIMVAASTQLFLIKEKAMETFKYVCLNKRFSSNVK
jgi:hypothetical protein